MSPVSTVATGPATFGDICRHVANVANTRRGGGMTAHPLARWSTSAAHAPMPNTALAHAFLRDAILVWARRQSGGERLALPSGRVDGDELRRVITALVCARGAP
jgi:hypothetical protein